MSVVLDASAVLAFLKVEPGGEIVREHLKHSVISTVNLLEVLEKLPKTKNGFSKSVMLLRSYQVEFVAFDEEQTIAAASIREQVGNADVSLADRVCLALAMVRNRPVLTADRLWKSLPLPVDVVLIRGEKH